MKTFPTPRRVIDETWAYLREQGTRGNEGVAYWGAAASTGTTAPVTSAEFPERYERVGRYVAHVGFDELVRIGARFAARGERIVARLHTHAEDGFHSEVDDGSPLTGRPGFISIVVGDFARAAPDIATCALFEWTADGTWREIPSAEARARFPLVMP